MCRPARSPRAASPRPLLPLWPPPLPTRAASAPSKRRPPLPVRAAAYGGGKRLLQPGAALVHGSDATCSHCSSLRAQYFKLQHAPLTHMLQRHLPPPPPLRLEAPPAPQTPSPQLLQRCAAGWLPPAHRTAYCLDCCGVACMLSMWLCGLHAACASCDGRASLLPSGGINAASCRHPLPHLQANAGTLNPLCWPASLAQANAAAYASATGGASIAQASAIASAQSAGGQAGATASAQAQAQGGRRRWSWRP